MNAPFERQTQKTRHQLLIRTPNSLVKRLPDLIVPKHIHCIKMRFTHYIAIMSMAIQLGISAPNYKPASGDCEPTLSRTSSLLINIAAALHSRSDAERTYQFSLPVEKREDPDDAYTIYSDKKEKREDADGAYTIYHDKQKRQDPDDAYTIYPDKQKREDPDDAYTIYSDKGKREDPDDAYTIYTHKREATM